MDKDIQPDSLKIKIKFKGENSAENPLAPDCQLKSTEGEPETSNGSAPPRNIETEFQDKVTISSKGGSQDHSADQNNPSENTQLQMVPYDPSVDGTGNVPNPDDCRTPSLSRERSSPNQMPRIFPSIGAFTVQCANCFKWRLIPTKEKYEEIREHIMEKAFYCETGREWRPNISCEDPPDITQDGSRLWAIDRPSIARPPPGWQRLLRIRAEGGTKFADVYYLSPTGKRLRSMVEVERYLNENPEYVAAGISLAKFSFQIPRPLQDNYVRKRPPPPRAAPTDGSGDHVLPRSLDPIEVIPISWARPEPDTNMELGRSSSSANYTGSAPGLRPEAESSKKQRTAA